MEIALCERATFRNADAQVQWAYMMYQGMVCHGNYAAIPHTLCRVYSSC